MISDMIWQKIAWLLPRRLVYWATIRAGAHASTGHWSNQVVPEMDFLQVLERWNQ